MQRATLLVLAAIVAMALAEGQYYVPRSYYVIDAEGHASAPVPLRRLRRSVGPYPYVPSGRSTNAQAIAVGPNSSATATATNNAAPSLLTKSDIGEGGWDVPRYTYGSANPKALRH
ncbi:unnamed protein product, partial [Brenthis ino]